MDSGVLSAFFEMREDAQGAFRQLNREGFRSAALLHKRADGQVKIEKGHWFYRFALVVLPLLSLLALVGGPFLLVYSLSPAVFQEILPTTILVLISVVGGLVGGFWLKRFRFGLDPALVQQYSRSLLPGEILLILQAPVDAMALPVQILRSQGDQLPSVFIKHPSREQRDTGRDAWEALSREQIKERALYQAIDHEQLNRQEERNVELLQRLKKSRRWIQDICLCLTEASRLEQGVSPVAEWIIDNEFIVATTVRDILQNLPPRYYRSLPKISGDLYLKGMPFAYGLAKELVSDTELRLERGNIVSFLQTYQTVRTLSTAELWAIPQMLRIALVESIQSIAVTAHSDLRGRQLASFWANRLIAAGRADASMIPQLLGDLSLLEPSPYFCTQLVDHLYDEEAMLVPVKDWIESTLEEPLHECVLREQNRQSKAQISISNAFISLRQLNQLDWRTIFEQVSSVEKILRTDPAGVYPVMDFATRDSYRQMIEKFSRLSGRPEEEIARTAIELAGQAEVAGEDVRLAHIGTYLIGRSRCDLAGEIGCREPVPCLVRDWLKRHHAWLFLSAVAALTALFVSVLLGLGLVDGASLEVLWFALLAVIPGSQVAVQIVNFLVTHLLPPSLLPKMDFSESGIPADCRTLVVVPTLLVNVGMLRKEVEQLEIRYLANREENLLFSLFTDFTDAAQPVVESDRQLLRHAVGTVEELNRRHGDGRFLLFHREREWSDSEQKYIGRERKRGKLEELNRLLVDWSPQAAAQLVRVGEAAALQNIRFVITLDSDTQLPHATARRMIETLAHPLNRPCLTSAGTVSSDGYTIIQPRVSPALSNSVGWGYSRFFADAAGIDPYTKAISDVYQDLSGQGSYHGKGIYDVRVFHQVLAERFPQERILSHDLIEGEHVRVGLASDIELFDEFPKTYQGDCVRLHRWIRGDWQIAAWLLPRVPLAGGARGANPLGLLSRWKIFDNLRRSLMPAGSVALLLGAWLANGRMGLVATLAIALQLFFHPLAQLHAIVSSRIGLKSFSPRQMLHNLLRSAVEAALLPHQAVLSLDAIMRAGYRCLVSKRNLLQWTAAQLNATGPKIFAFYLFLTVPFSVLFCVLLILTHPANLPVALPLLVLWLVSPLLIWFLSRQPGDQRDESPLPVADRRYLSAVMRRTWRYFAEFVSERTHWLPPDNYQVSHQNMLAMRTSPTNIGLWMLSLQGAHDAGYVSPQTVLEGLGRTMATIDRLERYQGHLLNWYDVASLQPLEPRYVSSVDSGNLLGSLWVLDQGLQELVTRPLLSTALFSGLRDTVHLVLEEDREQLTDEGRTRLERVLSLCSGPAGPLDHLLKTLQGCGDLVGGIDVSPSCARAPEQSDSADEDWLPSLRQQLDDWQSCATRLLGWAEFIATDQIADRASLDPDLTVALHKELETVPSLQDLAAGDVASVQRLSALRLEGGLSPDLSAWLDAGLSAFEHARQQAAELCRQAQALSSEIGELARAINMAFLYSPERKLFAVGYNVSADRLDTAYYDLLASESRFGSFVAIARGEVPMEHWFSLGRPYGRVGHGRVLLSWTGTMFEYLMPVIFQHSYSNSLLDRATRHAVAEQIRYARKHRIPWGISESAHGDLDLNRTYQYKAFGVPTLGLKRILQNQRVVAPYASLLAVSIAPEEVVRNLRRLERLGMLQTYGFYESIDFSRRDQPSGERGVMIRAYMAHHQGMSFLALINYLHDSPLPRRFHADPRVRAFELLLQERIPPLPPLHLVSSRETVPKLSGVGEVSSAAFRFTTPDTPIPKSQFLSNGRYDLMITNSGGGYSQWGGNELNRWRVDRTSEQWGCFCYILDQEDQRVWSNTHLPTAGDWQSYTVEFPLDRAIFRRLEHDIEVETEVVVSPEDDVEIRRMTFVNHSDRRRRLTLTSYLELALAPHRADLQHPAFNKLFVQTEALPGQRALLAYRRPRSETAEPLFVAHRFTCDQGRDAPFSFETDRRTFIGRGRSLRDPHGCRQPLGNTQGFVLDPVFSLRREIELSPNQHVQVTLVNAAGSSRDQLIALMHKYGEEYTIERAIDFAWRASQIELRMMHIQPEEARRFRQLADHLLFPNPLLRASSKIIAENNIGQSGLWAYGISGDLPIILITIAEVRDVSVVRQLLQAQAYWLRHGLVADLVILNEESGSYEAPLRERLENLIQAHSMFIGREQPGGIFLRSVDQLPQEDVRLLKAVASVVLVAARGPLSQQLGVSRQLPELPPRREPGRTRAPDYPQRPLSSLTLEWDNGVGGFTRNGREYVVTLGPGVETPAPWINVMANPDFGVIVSETGAGFCWYGNSQRNRLTQWSNDPVLDPAGDVLYLRDEESGDFWTPTAAPVRGPGEYRARHGTGYSIFEHNCCGIEQSLTVFVPLRNGQGDPLKLQRLRLKNRSGHSRRLTLSSYTELVLGETRESSQMHLVTQWDGESQALLAWNRYHPDYPERVTFVAADQPVRAYCCDRTCFIGRNRTLADPLAMELEQLACQSGAGLDPCASLQIELSLAGGAEQTICLITGQAAGIDEARALIARYRQQEEQQNAFVETVGWWDGLLGGIEVKTPEPAADVLINRWLLYQSLSCRIWGRSAVYQSGGAFGYRDQLQDVMAFLATFPGLAREQILLAASRQFSEGDVQHWWHPPGGAGIRSRISDDLFWLPYVVARYVRVTGDHSLLHAEAPFLRAAELEADQHEVFAVPEVTFERGTVFEHCRRVVKRGLTAGAMGLPLIGTGDWNDGMNLVGAEGRGESVWLAWFVVDVLQGMSELAEIVGDRDLAGGYLEERSQLVESIEKSCWDGAWYLRATFDDGSPLGSARSMEAKIDSLPQSWAWLTGAADPQRAEQALDSAWQQLVRPEEKIVQLFDPPFDQSFPSPGYIKGYPPGVRENGGQYTHAALWFAMALARKGDGERAVQMLRMLNPVEHARTPEDLQRYKVEPYVVAADVYRLPGRIGQGGWSWYTGSAAWMYRAWVEEVLGLKIRGKQMWLDPVIPADWSGFSLTYRRERSEYRVEVENPQRCERGVLWVELDGRRLPEGKIPLEGKAERYRITVRMGT
ncbi:MAG: glucoamylase family protein [Desulfuromonadales bacterium]|nr:glucoamylase family protein [Desulfuromonadales bacterium]